MPQLYHVITPYKCKICHNDSLYFIGKDKNLLPYKDYFKISSSAQHLVANLAMHGVDYLRCMHCNLSFIIDWTKGWPEQLVDMKILRQFGVAV